MNSGRNAPRGKHLALAAIAMLAAGAMSPVVAGDAKPNSFWWPDRVDLSPLRAHAPESNPYGESFDYAREFSKLDLAAVKEDIEETLTDSQEWWPADWGNYGPFFIRMAWHSAGTYRTSDGRGGAGGGQQRFDPLNSWPDNGNLDKARRLLWPVKKKYGKQLSWADLMVLAGNVAMESMGFQTLGFAGGRTDDWEPELVYWGPEGKMLADKRHKQRTKKGHSKGDSLRRGLGASQMGLIYVNPEGPNGVPDPLAAAKAIRTTFARMAMDDEETVALIAGGHTFGKVHGAHEPDDCLGADPGGAPVEAQGFGWKNECGKGHSEDTVTSGLEGAWTAAPTRWTHMYLDNLFRFEWKQTKSPAGATQWIPKDEGSAKIVPDAHVKGKYNTPIMLTTDLSLKFDPAYRKISKRFHENPKEFEKAFARAWFKLTHRDMGPRSRYVGSEVPAESFVWQDPLPERKFEVISKADVAKLKAHIAEAGLSVPQLVRTAWASASSYRNSDMRGGANGARVRLEPQRSWDANDPAELKMVLGRLEAIQKKFNGSLDGKRKVSLADMIVLAGAVGVEEAAAEAGFPVKVPFEPGRVDARQDQTDVESFGYLEPQADAFRNFYQKGEGVDAPVDELIDKANQLALTVPEMTALVGGMRALGATSGDAEHGVLTDRPGVLSTDFFVNLLDMRTKWQPSTAQEHLYIGYDLGTGKKRWTATPVDLVFGSSAELRAIAEVYASEDGRAKFVRDFVAAWSKVMQLDRFDLHR